MQQPEDYLYEEYKKEMSYIEAEKEWLFIEQDILYEKKKKTTIVVKYEGKVINLENDKSSIRSSEIPTNTK